MALLCGGTGPQVLLGARAVQLVQVDGPAAPGEQAALSRHIDGVAAAELGTHHIGVPQVPLVVTHRAPSPVFPYFHPSGAAVSSACQPDGLLA